jgi:hypothetical protein
MRKEEAKELFARCMPWWSEGSPGWRSLLTDRTACCWRTRSSTGVCAFGFSGPQSEGLKSIVKAPSTMAGSERACGGFARGAVVALLVELSVKLLLRGGRW